MAPGWIRRPFRTENCSGLDQTLRVWLISIVAPRLADETNSKPRFGNPKGATARCAVWASQRNAPSCLPIP
jgi:hypothetical protein